MAHPQASKQKKYTLWLKVSSIALLILLNGCTHYQQRQVINHPGNYALINLGEIQIGDDVMRITQVHDKVFYSYENVLGPTFFSAYLLEHTQILEGETVLDVGTGSGVQAIYATEKAKYILATDIDELALKNTLLNAQRLNVPDIISVRKSDLFKSLKPDEKFDVIIASIPYAWNKKTQHRWALQERFFEDVGKHLNPDGRIYFITGWLNNLRRTKIFIKKNNLKIVRLNMGYSTVRDLEPIVYTIQHKTFVLEQVNNYKNVSTKLKHGK